MPGWWFRIQHKRCLFWKTLPSFFCQNQSLIPQVLVNLAACINESCPLLFMGHRNWGVKTILNLNGRKSQGKMCYTYSFTVSMYSLAQIVVFLCAKVSRIEEYLDRLTGKITFRVAESGSAKVALHICHEISRLYQGDYLGQSFIDSMLSPYECCSLYFPSFCASGLICTSFSSVLTWKHRWF